MKFNGPQTGFQRLLQRLLASNLHASCALCSYVEFALVDPELLWTCITLRGKVNRPGVAQRVSVGLGFQIFMTFGT